MLILNNNTVVVFSSLELKDALEKDNGYTYIYLGNSITLTEGIGISEAKSEIIIDGTYNYELHEYIDQKKLGTTDGIYVTSPYTQKITVKNMNITGYNYYGIIYVPENSSYSSTTVEYSSINYTGPELSYNPMGTTRIIDSTITIKDNFAVGNEVCECNKIEIGGTTNIIHNSTSNSGFWFRNSNPTLTILKNANVYFTSAKRELFYGTYDLSLLVSKGASLYISTYNGLASGTYGTKTCVVDHNATLSITKTNYSTSYATWYNYGEITLNYASSLDVINNYDKITSSNYNIYCSGKDTKIIFNNPKKVVLYNLKSNVFYTNSETYFDFSFNRLNIFNEVIQMDSLISKDNLPTYSWYKDNISNISGTFTNKTTNILQHNFTYEELDKLPALDNLDISSTKTLSIGIFVFNINALTDTDLKLTGITTPYASILIEYDNISSVIEADENGNYIYNYSTPLSIGTIVNFNAKEYNNILYYTKQVEVVYSGELAILNATTNFQFETYALNRNPLLCPRLNDLSITVLDSRIHSSNWKLFASITDDLTSQNGYKLKDALVFVDSLGNIFPLSTTPTLVYTGKSNNGNLLSTTVRWEENEGILLRLNSPLEVNEIYDSNIIWKVEE